ncbi:hypothetical protein GCM10027413_07400 [Conyzicola nivalis]|uniref:Uncharacterized protein n=1 Tax=Conyzicola nivalis TaxID=1477021 RepID=A0A916SN65_9MICO|nr:hypothetical protein GCM10010979_19230 [Conyzicola nivalis]
MLSTPASAWHRCRRRGQIKTPDDVIEDLEVARYFAAKSALIIKDADKDEAGGRTVACDRPWEVAAVVDGKERGASGDGCLRGGAGYGGGRL